MFQAQQRAGKHPGHNQHRDYGESQRMPGHREAKVFGAHGSCKVGDWFYGVNRLVGGLAIH